MDLRRAGCAATRTSGSEARAGETGRSRGRYRAPVRPYDLLRCGATSQVLGHRVMAPSTIGTFLRSFTFGHVRQLDRFTEQLLTRAWAAGAGPGDGPMTMDLDSTVCQVHGHAKQGAAYGYTHTLGYHPLLATRAERGEVLHPRQRTGRAHTAPRQGRLAPGGPPPPPSAPGGPTPPAERPASSTSWPYGCAALAPAAS